MTQHMKLGAIFAGILMCCSAVSTFAAPIEAASGLDFDEDTEQHYVEIPVDSIQQFVQIYGSKITMSMSNLMRFYFSKQ